MMLDDTDLKIIAELKCNGRITMKELGERVHLTGQAAANRVLKLEEEGVIEGYTIRLDRRKAGYTVHAFIQVYTKSLAHTELLLFFDQHQAAAAIINRYRVSGEGCYFIEVVFPSNNELDRFLQDLTQYANYKISIVISQHQQS